MKDLDGLHAYGNIDTMWPLYLTGGAIAWWLWSARKASADSPSSDSPRRRRRRRRKRK